MLEDDAELTEATMFISPPSCQRHLTHTNVCGGYKMLSPITLPTLPARRWERPFAVSDVIED